LLQENGPFLWQSGTYAPVRNPFSWSNLTNIVYIDQPAGTGLSPGPATVQNEIDVSNQFNDFWKRFIQTFSMQGYKVYITGESYAGQYIPYLASGMLDQNDTTHFNLKGIQINDPSINEDNVMIYGSLCSNKIFRLS
jgi:carboxypeptidase D